MSNDQRTIDFGNRSSDYALGSNPQPVPHTGNSSRAAQADGDWTGRSIGEYVVDGVIGVGGNGKVYRAIHKWLDLPVAVKLLTNVNANDSEALLRFQREARIAARLNHSGIVRCTDGGVVGDQLFLVTDFVEGENTRDVVRRCGWLSVADACEIIRQTADALDYISQQGMVHRDIKPSNIMLDNTGRVRVLDMGLARSAVGGHTLTATGQVMGTLDFMSPEQAVDTRTVDFRSDIYSLGCTFYFLLAGRAPFASDQHETVAAKLLAHIEAVAPDVSKVRRDVPKRIARLIEQMLSKDVQSRPQSFQQVIEVVAAPASSHHLSSLAAAHSNSESNPSNALQSPLTGAGMLMGNRLVGAIRGGVKLILAALGFLERHAPTRPGQRSHYTVSFRWIKGVFALALIAFMLWATGFQFTPSDSQSSFSIQGSESTEFALGAGEAESDENLFAKPVKRKSGTVKVNQFSQP